MHISFICASEKKSIKKVRTILDSYAMRTGRTSWQAPMTLEGLAEIKNALSKVATRQMAVAAYRNYGNQRMKLVWIVGSKHKFSPDGAFPIASKKRDSKNFAIEPWISVASLLAGAAGYMHDIGKASVHFQNKLKQHQIIKDEVRHEWLSMKLLQRLRKNDWDWNKAWTDIQKNIAQFSLGDIKEIEDQFIETAIEAVDYLVVSHHGLLADDSLFPTSGRHVRVKTGIQPHQIMQAGEIDQNLFKIYQNRMQRLDKKIADKEKKALYWKAITLYSRAALIFADHTVSALHYLGKTDQVNLFANTKINEQKQRYLDQPLNWHLHTVGERASYIATKMSTHLDLTGLSQQTVDYICEPTRHSQFKWQNVVANAVQKKVEKNPNIPSLVLNIAGTGSGKTRMNLRLACTLSPENPRLAIAQNLRSLTLQTGEALKKSMNLGDEELTTIIGDQTTQKLFEQKEPKVIDEDENQVEPMFDTFGEDGILPKWLEPLFQGKHQKDKKILTSPIVVSTIDYLIAAGEPHRQGHHVKALLRILSSDLILDEIDSYEPSALMAVLRLVQLSALYGKNVICSSATLSDTVAQSIYRAFESGIEMREALYEQQQKYLIVIADNEIKPNVWVQTLKKEKDFIAEYQSHLNQLQDVLAKKAEQPYRLAQLAHIFEHSVEHWQSTVLEQVHKLHQAHQWTFEQHQVSFGLVRVANIKHAISLANFLSEQLPHAKIACYHANDWLISRFYKEQRLDTLLSRYKDTKKRLTGNEHILKDQEIRELVNFSTSDNIPFIVITTPVEEVGRDHDFDWGIIDVSSVQSIVQTAGRINRHRLKVVKQPNISILQFNYRYCEAKQKYPKKRFSVFKWPGYEGYYDDSLENLYSKQNLKDLLPWDEQEQLVVDARLRFDKKKCLFAQEDDAQIQRFCEDYFYPNGNEYFSNSEPESCLLTEQLYKDTPLRSISRQEVYYFTKSFEIFKKIDSGTFEHNPKTGKYEPQKDQKVSFCIQELQPNSWLAKDPQTLVDLCADYGIEQKQGCKVSLAIYQENMTSWTYDYSFGIYKN